VTIEAKIAVERIIICKENQLHLKIRNKCSQTVKLDMQLDFLKKQMTQNIVKVMSHTKAISKNLIWNQIREKKIIKVNKNRNWLSSIDQQHFYLNKVLRRQRKLKKNKISYLLLPLKHLIRPLMQKQIHLNLMCSVQIMIALELK